MISVSRRQGGSPDHQIPLIYIFSPSQHNTTQHNTNLSLVARAHRLAHKFGETPIKGVLSALKACPCRSPRSTFLTPHAKSTARPLSCSDPSALALLPVHAARSRLQSCKRPGAIDVRQLRLICITSLPVEYFHGHLRGGGWGRAFEAGSEAAATEVEALYSGLARFRGELGGSKG